MELNLVEYWLRRDPVRWCAGALGGIVAAFIAVGVAMLLSAFFQSEIWVPIKVAATAFLGAEAMQYGFFLLPIVVGLLAIGVLSAFLGFVFAHFVWSNQTWVLLVMGSVWGIFSWIFIWNLFLQSVRSIYALGLSSAVAFLVCMAFGLGLVVIGPLDRVVRSQRGH